jgi:ethanolamine utilization protein EutN
MYLARVIGTVVASTKADNMAGLKLLVVEPVAVGPDGTQRPDGEPHIAVDAAQAGEGDLVSCVGSREAALAVQPSFVPVDAAIIGIVDHADIEGGPKKGRR